ncbi:fumarate hydratase FumD, partial [Salmonella enterica]|nr:fumarate hydratase FumD [Salmonella enterica]
MRRLLYSVGLSWRRVKRMTKPTKDDELYRE